MHIVMDKSGKTTGWMVLLMMAILLGCRSSFVIQSENLTDEHFTERRTFKFANPDNLPKSNFSFSEENKKIIFDAIASNLQARGYTSRQQAELVIRVQGGTANERESRSNNYAGPAYPLGYYGYGYPYSFGRHYEDISRKKTTIIIDILDADTRKLLWQGVATGEMGKKIEEVEPRLQEAIIRIFEKLPQ